MRIPASGPGAESQCSSEARERARYCVQVREVPTGNQTHDAAASDERGSRSRNHPRSIGHTSRTCFAPRSRRTLGPVDICATLETVTVYRIVFEGPASLAVGVATALADADGVELVASEPPTVVDVNTVRLGLAVEGVLDAVTDAIAGVRDGMPTGATIAVADD